MHIYYLVYICIYIYIQHRKLCNGHFIDAEMEPWLLSFYNNTEVLIKPRRVELSCVIQWIKLSLKQ